MRREYKVRDAHRCGVHWDWSFHRLSYLDALLLTAGGQGVQAEAACVAQGVGGSLLAHGQGQDCMVLLPGK